MESEKGSEPGNALGRDLAEGEVGRERVAARFVGRFRLTTSIAPAASIRISSGRRYLSITPFQTRRPVLQSAAASRRADRLRRSRKRLRPVLRGLARRTHGADDVDQVRGYARGQFFTSAEKLRANIPTPSGAWRLAARYRSCRPSPAKRALRGAVARQLLAAARECPETRDEVAAVHGRDVARMQAARVCSCHTN